MTALSPISIVLVEPAGPLNVGSVARIMANLGLSRLVLVNPQCDPLSEEARQMAVHAQKILDGAVHVSSLAEALGGCQRVVATTARNRSLPTALEHPRQVLPWLLGTPSALVFGREDRGLSNEELNLAQRFARIPSTASYASLNLAQSVAICAYELYNLAGEPGSLGQVEGVPEAMAEDADAPIELLEAYYGDLEDLLLKIGYLYPHTANARMEKFRRLHNRAHPSSQEVAMLRGILRQVNWALNQQI